MAPAPLEVESQRLLELLPTTQAKSESSCSCLKICGVIFGCILALVLLLVLRVWFAECAIESFDHHYILPKNAIDAGLAKSPFDRGTSENMNLQGIREFDMDIDLQGVWWMDGNPLTAEHLVSFASAEGKKPFPSIVPVYNNMQRRWTWTDGIIGRFVMAYYAFDATAESPLTFNFTNSSSASIIPVGGVFNGNFGFHKINDNEWDRPDANYILRRIVDGDGSEGPFWQKFVDWYDGIEPTGKVLVWSSDSDCLRRCQYFAPCFVCGAVC